MHKIENIAQRITNRRSTEMQMAVFLIHTLLFAFGFMN